MPVKTETQSAAAPPESSHSAYGEFTRLHITPLDADLLKLVIPASILPQARGISYHTIETFPEKRYGFVELPDMEAEKLKKKLNGSTLRGSKVRVEKARPEEKQVPTGDDDEAEKKTKKSKDKFDASKKRKRDPEVAEGVALRDRKVKRGWTEATEPKKRRSRKDKESNDKEKKKRTKSKYTEKEECLLKTTLPANAVGNVAPGDLPRKKSRKGKSREVTIHEFEKTTKFPSFLKDSASAADGKTPADFVEGKGWVDEQGEVVEAVRRTRQPKPIAKGTKTAAKPAIEEEEEDDSTSSSGTSSGDEESSVEDVVRDKARDLDDRPKYDESSEDETSSSEEEIEPRKATPKSAAKADQSRPVSSSSSRSLTIKIPNPVTPSAPKVHPLEALYKRPKQDVDATETPEQGAQPFSFFDADNDEGASSRPTHPTLAIPMTPFTREDFEWRNTRSAAPTPDTAHPSRMQNFWASQDSHGDKGEASTGALGAMEEVEDEDAEEDEEGAADGAGAKAQQGSSDFQGWFWENRRELNRSWMKRRKTAAKEKRHRDNKARASRAV